MSRLQRKSGQSKVIMELFGEFQLQNRAKNLSSSTIKFYDENTKPFFAYLQENKIERTIGITSEIMDNFALWLQERHDNIITVKTYQVAARRFCYWAMEKNYLSSFKIKLVKTTNKVMGTYSNDELKKLLKRPNFKKCSFVEWRCWIMTIWFLSTGNRLSTAINIKVGDLDFKERFVILHQTKNKNEQIIPLSKTLVDELNTYINTWGLKADSYLFPNYEGSQLSPNATKLSMMRYNRLRGVNTTGIHKIRHSMAKNWVQDGGNVFALQQILGHSTLEMTRHYVALFGNDLIKDVDEHNLVEKIMPSRKHITRQK